MAVEDLIRLVSITVLDVGPYLEILRWLLCDVSFVLLGLRRRYRYLVRVFSLHSWRSMLSEAWIWLCLRDFLRLDVLLWPIVGLLRHRINRGREVLILLREHVRLIMQVMVLTLQVMLLLNVVELVFKASLTIFHIALVVESVDWELGWIGVSSLLVYLATAIHSVRIWSVLPDRDGRGWL